MILPIVKLMYLDEVVTTALRIACQHVGLTGENLPPYTTRISLI